VHLTPSVVILLQFQPVHPSFKFSEISQANEQSLIARYGDCVKTTAMQSNLSSDLGQDQAGSDTAPNCKGSKTPMPEKEWQIRLHSVWPPCSDSEHRHRLRMPSAIPPLSRPEHQAVQTSMGRQDSRRKRVAGLTAKATRCELCAGTRRVSGLTSWYLDLATSVLIISWNLEARGASIAVTRQSLKGPRTSCMYDLPISEQSPLGKSRRVPAGM
jgi:hypothetical protein